MNQHVNNTRYVQWAMDSISFDFQKQLVLREVSVNFLSEARIGEHYFIESYQTGLSFVHFIVCENDNRKVAAIWSKWEKRRDV